MGRRRSVHGNRQRARGAHPANAAYAAQPETAAALVASVDAGEPVQTEYEPGFVDGAGAAPSCRACGSGRPHCLPVPSPFPPIETAAAVRLLAERAHVVAEGAGALALAAALAGRAGTGRIVCIVSGGNIDADVLAEILSGGTPGSRRGPDSTR